MRVLVTGGAGFIGSHLAERLISQGSRVIALDDLSTGSRDNLAALLEHPDFEFVEDSILHADVVRRLVERCDLVVHLAAVVGVRNVLSRPLATIRTNVEGTDVVLDACARRNRKVLVASSSEVYGKNGDGPLCEEADSVLGPASVSRWSYATAKKIDEFLALAYAQTFGLPVIVTRFFNIVEPRQAGRYGMVLPSFVRAALAGEPIRVFGDGRQTRNFCFVDDCIEALLRLLALPEGSDPVFNIGGVEEISMLDLARRVRSITGSPSPIVRVPYEQAYPEGGFEDMRRRVPCICRIRRAAGWSPSTSVDAMILATAGHERHRLSPPGRPLLTPCFAETPETAAPSATASSPAGR
jgi:UDP-glucose 4-epimerase